MLSVTDCREALGPDAGTLSDEEVAQLRACLYGLAEVAVDIHLSRVKIATAGPGQAGQSTAGEPARNR